MDARLHHYDVEAGVLPAAAADPWTLVGAGAVSLVDAGVEIDAAGGATYHERLIRPPRASRASDTLAFGARVAVTAIGATSWAAASATGILIADGKRAAGVAIGTSIEWIDTAGNVLGVALATHAPTRAADVRLVKRGTDVLELWVGRARVATLPWVAAPLSTLTPRIRWGALDLAGTGTSVWDRVEASLNMELAAQWRVDSVADALPVLMHGEQASRLYPAILRATVGTFEHVMRLLENLREEFSAGRRVVEDYAAVGDTLPSLLAVPWTLQNPAGIAVSRERIVFDAGLTSSMFMRRDFARAPTQSRVAATWTVLEVDGGGKAVGPYMELYTGARRVVAQLAIITTGQYGWSLASQPDTVDHLIGAAPYPVEPRASHRVELVATDAVALLIVDGQVVDREPLASFNSSTQTNVRVGCLGTASIGDTRAAVEDVVVESAEVDDGNRPLFRRLVGERLHVLGGREATAELHHWHRRYYEAHLARGTLRGMLMEARRLTASDDAEVWVEERSSNWYIGETFPGEPIFLGDHGTSARVVVEIPATTTTADVGDIALLMRRYMLPMGVRTLYYEVALATLVDGAVVDGGATWDYPVKSIIGFAAGDTVVLRDATNTSRYQATLISVDAVNGRLSVSKVAGAAITVGDAIRRTLTRS